MRHSRVFKGSTKSEIEEPKRSLEANETPKKRQVLESDRVAQDIFQEDAMEHKKNVLAKSLTILMGKTGNKV